MSSNPEFIRFNTIKEYITDVQHMRSSTGAVHKLIQEFDSTIQAVIAEAQELALEDNRKTIMKRDIVPALEKHLGKKHLTWQETTQEVILKNPTDLGKISKAINDYIDKQKK